MVFQHASAAGECQLLWEHRASAKALSTTYLRGAEGETGLTTAINNVRTCDQGRFRGIFEKKSSIAQGVPYTKYDEVVQRAMMTGCIREVRIVQPKVVLQYMWGAEGP